jgi:hypothetical protein
MTKMIKIGNLHEITIKEENVGFVLSIKTGSYYNRTSCLVRAISTLEELKVVVNEVLCGIQTEDKEK